MEVILDFPKKNGQGYSKTINYIHVLVKSNSGSVDVDIVKGGIGEPTIKLKVSAYHTQLFNYEVQVYGI